MSSPSGCPEGSDVVAKAVYGVIGLGAFVALKYIYPSLKKFYKKLFGLKENDDQVLESQ
jgi:hypothetical protein